MKFLKFIFPLLVFFLFSCENKELIQQNEQLKEQVSELKAKITEQNLMMSRMRQSDDKLMLLASKISGIKATISTNMGNIEIKFFPDKAPIQCFNFITRAECGYYDNTKFHRVIPGFMIQGGDINSKKDNKSLYGQGTTLVPVPHEFNDLKHKRGILSTARTEDLNAGAGSQFFILQKDAPWLDNQYTAFGEVTNGIDIVDKIASTKTIKPGDIPVNPVIVKTIRVYR